MYKLLLYFVIPAVSAAAPLVVIPAITSTYGANGWASIAIALSIGNAGAVIAELGWGVVGPQRVAREPGRKKFIFEEALSSKLVGVAIVAPVAGFTTALIASEYRLAAALLSIALVGNALTPAWYFIGLGKPIFVLLCDTLPRVLFAILSALVILAGGPIESYGIGMLIAVLSAYLLSVLIGRTVRWPSRVAFRHAPSVIKNQSIIILGRCVSTLYTSLPTALLAIVSPGAVATFSALDRPMRMGLSILGGVPARLQSWIGTPDRQESYRRSRVSLLLNTGLGIVAGLVYALAMPTIAHLLFTGTVTLTYELTAIGGLLVAIICSSRGFGLALVAADVANSISAAVIGAAITGVSLILILGNFWGVAGALVGLIAAEIVGLLIQWALLRRAWQRRTSQG
jgi:O-antigen/teichoic acid export membrane protein